MDNGKESGETDTDSKPRELIDVLSRTTERLAEVVFDTERDAWTEGPLQYSERFSFHFLHDSRGGCLGLLAAR